jgi:hypothetical protein
MFVFMVFGAHVRGVKRNVELLDYVNARLPATVTFAAYRRLEEFIT